VAAGDIMLNPPGGSTGLTETLVVGVDFAVVGEFVVPFAALEVFSFTFEFEFEFELEGVDSEDCVFETAIVSELLCSRMSGSYFERVLWRIERGDKLQGDVSASSSVVDATSRAAFCSREERTIQKGSK
jgi:hypothetical protein